MDNKDQEACEAYRKTLEKPEASFFGWQNAKATQFSIYSAKNEKLPPTVDPLEAMWFFKASSLAEANRAWYAHSRWKQAS